MKGVCNVEFSEVEFLLSPDFADAYPVAVAGLPSDWLSVAFGCLSIYL